MTRVKLPTLVIVAIACLLVQACVADPGESVTVENRSDAHVDVYQDDEYAGVVAPGKSQRYSVIALFRGETEYTVRRDGDILASQRFTWEEIDRADGYRIVIE